MRILAHFIASGAIGGTVAVASIGATWHATEAEDGARAQQQRAQKVARDVAGLVGVTHVFQRERDELSIAEWQTWHGSLVRDLAGAEVSDTSQSEVELIRDAATRLPTLFERALATMAAPTTDFERRKRDQAYELLLGDTQAMADAAFRWSRNAGDERMAAEVVRERVAVIAIATLALLLILLAWLSIRRVLRPLARLATATEALERGEDVPLFASTEKDELGSLKRRFDAMTLALRRRAEELKQAERRMRAITDNVPVLITEFDKDAKIVFANATVGRVYGVPAESLVGKSVVDVRGEDGGRQLWPHIRSVLQGEPVEFDSTQLLNGTMHYFQQLYVPRKDAAGVVDGYYAVSMDITERKRHEMASQASEQRLKAITDNIPAVVSHFDRELRADFGNLAAEKVLRKPLSELMGKTFREIRGEEVWAIAQPHIEAVFKGEPREFESFVKHPDGVRYFVQRYVPDFDAEGQVQGFYSVSFDITERRRSEELQAQSEKRLRDIADNLPVMISYIDRDERLLFLNETFSRWTGLDHRATIGKTVLEAIPGPLYQQRKGYLRLALSGQRVEFDMDSTAQGVERALHTIYLPDTGPDGVVRGLYALSSDVTERRQFERRLTELARTDSLTGLPNRYSFNEQLVSVLLRGRRAHSFTALLFLDIDKFKLINDTHGHGVGDEVLREFARRLSGLVRTTDFVGRLAGDEFVIILEGLHAFSEAELVAAKIVEAVNRPFEISVGPIDVATSIGIAWHRGDALPGEELLAMADKALYMAKAQGRNQYRTYPGQLN